MMGDDDYWDFYNEFTPKARKEHRCGECGRTITKGETYWTQGGLYEGEFVWNKTCAHCTVAAQWLETVCGDWIFGARQEDLTEHVIGHEKYLRTRPLTRLVRWMRSDWRDREGHLRPVEDVQQLTNDAITAYREMAA
jgi:hypothetical protein